MKFAFLSESSADEAALASFCSGVLGRDIEIVPSRVQIRRGWPALKESLGPALRALKFTDAEHIVVCADSDGAEATDRRAQLAEIVRRTETESRVTVALAVPSIEAWWLAHQYAELHERGWSNRLITYPGYDKLELKRRLYGTDRPLLTDSTRIMVEAAREAAGHHINLKQRFPLGLAPLIERLTTYHTFVNP